MIATDLATARVIADPQVRSGQPVIRGTRITVSAILTWLGGGLSESAILADFPELATEHIRAALQFAAQLPSGSKDQVVQ